MIACFARILTYFATRIPAQPFATKERYGCGVPLAGIPYLYTPTDASCSSSELFGSLPACRKRFFGTLRAAAFGSGSFIKITAMEPYTKEANNERIRQNRHHADAPA